MAVWFNISVVRDTKTDKGVDIERDAVAQCCDTSPEVKSNTRWLSVWRQAVKEQCCLDNCDALLIIAKHLTSAAHIHAHTRTHIYTMDAFLHVCASFTISALLFKSFIITPKRIISPIC